MNNVCAPWRRFECFSLSYLFKQTLASRETEESHVE